MNKQTKMILGVGVLAVAGYLIWKSQQPKKTAGLLQAGSLLSDTSAEGTANCGAGTDNCCKGTKVADGYKCCKSGNTKPNTLNVGC